MKKLFFSVLILGSIRCSFGAAYQSAVTFTTDTRTVAISSNSAAPTQILTKDGTAQRTWIVNNSVFSIFISSVSNNLSTSASFFIPGIGTPGNAPVIWSPDGELAPFAGQLFAISSATPVAQSISIFRSK